MTEKLDSAPPKPALKVSSSEGTSHLWTFPKLHPLLALEHDTTQNTNTRQEKRETFWHKRQARQAARGVASSLCPN